MKHISIFLMLLFFAWNVQGQDLASKEQELVELLDKLRAAKDDAEKGKANIAFKKSLEQAMLMTGAFDYPFSQLKTLGTIKSPDNYFRLFNWNIEKDDYTQTYYCYILLYDDKKKEYKTIELKDNSFMLPQKPTEILEATDWYGALYYRIIPMKKGSKTLYTVLGWDGNNSASTMKVIDVFNFVGNTVKLGSPVFRMPKETHKRIFFEFAKKTTMHLNYEEKYQRIIFDHLAPESPALAGMYSMYLPDLSNDAFVLKDGKWYFVEDVIGVNEKGDDVITVSYFDEKSGQIKERKLKNKWQEPSNTHVATTPEEQEKQVEKKQNEAKKSGKKPKKNPQSYNPVNSSLKKGKKR
jgi:hypothetical protein